jgi:hypothetical protein
VRTGDGAGRRPGDDDVDPADLWVLDPVTGEYRMRQPGELPPRPAPPRPAPAPAPARTAAASAPARRRKQSGARTGPWIAGAVCFLAVVGGITAYAVLRSGSGSTSADSATVGAVGSPCAAVKPTSAPTPGTSIEPAVSGSFLDGPQAAKIDIRVSVLDGSGTFGQAQAVIGWMQNTEVIQHSSNGGPAPAVIPRTTLVYAPDQVSQARVIAAEMGLPASSLHGDGDTSGPTGYMVLTLGEDFHGVGKPFSVPVPASSSTAAPAAGAAGAGTGCGGR